MSLHYIYFYRTMSNTAPAYLEGFQRIVISVDEISGPEDIKHFVSDHKELTVNPDAPEFERHPYMTGEAVSYKNMYMYSANLWQHYNLQTGAHCDHMIHSLHKWIVYS